MAPLVSVIMPVYRDWERLALCLEALSRQSLGAERIEIIVANNEPEPRAPLAPLPANARLIHEPKPGSYAARNAALQLARGEVVAFTDSDCVPEPQWLERALAIIAERPGARVTGPVTIFREPGTSQWAFVYEYHTAFKQKAQAALGRCATANLIVPKSAFAAVGLFNDALASGGDTEWGERAHRAGIPIVYDEAVAVGHPARRTLAEILKKRRRLAGSIALRKPYPTYIYPLALLLPPVRNFSRAVLAFKRGPLRPSEWLILYLVHWLSRIVQAQEFFWVRKGWKQANRS
jgi:GT2 family glycosyltransferase